MYSRVIPALVAWTNLILARLIAGNAGTAGDRKFDAVPLMTKKLGQRGKGRRRSSYWGAVNTVRPQMRTVSFTAMTCSLSLFLAAFGSAANAQDDGGQSLQSQASDPTASLMSFQFQDFYSPNLHNNSGSRNIAQFRAAIPFTFGGINNIARMTLPYVTSNDAGASGLGDMTLFDLAAFDQSWGRYGVGAVALLPTGANGVSAEKWGLGPALGFVARPEWGNVGLFNQNILTVGGNSNRADVNISTLQPILTVPLGEGWSLGASDMSFVYDWDRGEFISLPLGAKLSKLTKVNGLPVQWQLSYERNFYDTGSGAQDTIGLTAKLLVPK